MLEDELIDFDDFYEDEDDWPEHVPWVDAVVLTRTVFRPDPKIARAVIEITNKIAREAPYIAPLSPYSGPMYDPPKQRYQ